MEAIRGFGFIASFVAGFLVGFFIFLSTKDAYLTSAAGIFTFCVVHALTWIVGVLLVIDNKLPTPKPKEKLETELESQINDRWD